MSSSTEGYQVEITEVTHGLKREISWTGAFWVASGVPSLVLFSIGSIGATVAGIAWFVWTLSILMGFSQSFTYAEIAGLFPGKSGGASIYGAMAWVRYSKWIAPFSVWGNWYAWSPVLALGTALCSGYILNFAFDEDAKIVTWSQTIIPLGFLKDGLELRLNAVFFLSAFILVCVFIMQHFGIARAAKITMILGIVALIPLIIIGVLPLFTGDVMRSSFSPFAPIVGENGEGIWGMSGWKLFFGGMFIAAWSTYGFETAVCYTSEFKNPSKDTFKAIFSAGLLCMFVFIAVPVVFQGYLGIDGMAAPGIYSGFGVGEAMADALGGGSVLTAIVIIMLILALILCILTAMAGSSRTLFQASVDGWFPKYLSHVNKHGAPTYAMYTDLCFNLILLLMSDYVWVLAVSNCGYIMFNFLNLNSGWIHRMDSGHVYRPWKAPVWLIGLNTVLAFVNAAFMGIGANVWGKGTLYTAIVFTLLIVPVFAFRHYVQDKGKFPDHMYDDLGIKPGEMATLPKNAGVLPYVTIAAGLAVVATGAVIFWNF